MKAARDATGLRIARVDTRRRWLSRKPSRPMRELSGQSRYRKSLIRHCQERSDEAIQNIRQSAMRSAAAGLKGNSPL